MKLRNILAIGLVLVFMCAAFGGCADKEKEKGDVAVGTGANTETAYKAESEEAVKPAESAAAETKTEEKAKPAEAVTLPQLEPPKKGETIVTLSIEHKGRPLGDIVLRFFPEFAPKAVENFVTHAKDGYYDGVIFHRVMPGFMIQGGDPLGTGTGGESIWGGTFEYEVTTQLRHFRGALAMAHSSQPDSNGSQFYIVQNDDVGEQLRPQLEEMLNAQDESLGTDENGDNVTVSQYYPTEVINEYLTNGGAVSLDGGYTVFGQVVSGLDVVDKIANVEADQSDPNSPRPIDDVIIKKATVSTY